jgi:Sec-independent protein translocase protein TatA
MSFFGVGFFELILALIVAVMTFGPANLTTAAVQIAERTWRDPR